MLTDEEIHAIDSGHYYNGINFARAVEKAVLSKLAAGVSVEPVNNDLADDISAIDAMHRGDPSYEHDAYYMREQAVKRVRNGYQLFTTDQLNTAIAAARVAALEEAATLVESTELSGLNNDIQLQVFIGKMLIEYCKAIRALIGAKT